jgi:hypothetical protein
MPPGVTISVDGIALAHEAPGERAPVFGLPQRADHMDGPARL